MGSQRESPNTRPRTRDPNSFMARSKATKYDNDEGARLLAEVWADPAADAPRLVYADWLLQHGDPRGELIVLQVQGKDERRANQLVKKYGNAMVGALVSVVSKPTFERGFVSDCTVEIQSAKQRDLLRHPAWATVKSVTAYDPAVLVSPAMKSLRVVRALFIQDLAELAARKQPLAIEALEALVLNPVEDEQHWKDLYNVGAFENLRELGVILDDECDADVTFERWKWLLQGKLGTRLTRLRFDTSGISDVNIIDWMGAFDASRKLTTLELVPDGESALRFTRVGKKLELRYELHVRPRTSEDLEAAIRWRRAEALRCVSDASRAAAEHRTSSIEPHCRGLARSGLLRKASRQALR